MSDWPHVNSDVVLEGVTRWVRRFGEWPDWLEHPNAVAADLIRMGTFTRAELKKAGWGPKEIDG